MFALLLGSGRLQTKEALPACYIIGIGASPLGSLRKEVDAMDIATVVALCAIFTVVLAIVESAK